MTPSIDIRPKDLETVRDILASVLPAQTEVHVFGSRATGRTKRSSDLDLAIDAGRPLSVRESTVLADGFEESDLPYRVDFVDMHRVGENFRTIIDRDKVPLSMKP
ncbi:nucleotidyltransferase domain-containing protein [Skermanella mucosa]|uniref:nucleotidyltransferase family protein n=1 Tax=Skermanella mucosa TaxID=1789672 RepID=UPI00192C377E|nr:nucleotidyltransferase domain-containing protein [Skermanella mucosa]UEM22803.1 nucleotidyltransferase domain-containing protein [Skermanella mucosa]